MWPFSKIKKLEYDLDQIRIEAIDKGNKLLEKDKELNTLKAELRKYNEPAPIKDNLVFCFKDHNGKSYYKWNDQSTLPMSRMSEMVQFTMELAAGLDDRELNRLLDISDQMIMEAVKDPKRYTNVSAVNHEIRLRKKSISNTNLYYNLFAVNYIREDEDPLVYNLQAQKEKVKAFREGAETGAPFFFALPELTELCRRYKVLTENWNDIEKLSEQAKQRNEQALQIIES